MALPTSLPSTTTSTATANSTPTGLSLSAPSIDGSKVNPNMSPSTTATTSPIVATSNAAQSDFNNIKSNYPAINTGIQNQAANVAAQNAQKEAQAKLDEEAKAKQANEATTANAALTAANAKANAVSGTPTTDQFASLVGKTGYLNGVQDTSNAITEVNKNADGTYTIATTKHPNQFVVSAADLSKFSYNDQQIAEDQKAQNKIKDQQTLDSYNAQLDGITNGSIPLTDAQNAQIAGLRQQFQQLINQQVLTNAGASGIANVRGYQTGAAEYDPSFQAKTIGAIITAGQNKIADLNMKMSAAIAEMTEGFQDKNYSRIKDSYNRFIEERDKRTATLNETIDKAQKQVKEAQDAKVKADKVVYDEVMKPIQELAKSAAAMGATPDVTQKILASKDLGEAYTNAGMYASAGTGIIGEYNYYKANAEKMGVHPVDFNTYQTIDANRKAQVAKAGATVTSGAPASYKEWELAGKPGTYADFIKSQKPATAAQMQVAEYAARIDQAIPTLENLESTISNMNYLSFQAQKNLPAAMQTEDMQKYMQASRNFINAKLRRESGAVISPTEFSEAQAQYLPQPGDTQAVLDQKKANRDLILESLKKAAGGAYESANDLLDTGDMLNNVEKDAQKQVINLGGQHADLQPQLLKMEADKVPYSLILKWAQQQIQ